MNDGLIYTRSLPDGRSVFVYPLLYGCRLGVGKPGEPSMDDVW